MDVEYENYAQRTSRGEDAETDEELVIKYHRHRVEAHQADEQREHGHAGTLDGKEEDIVSQTQEHTETIKPPPSSRSMVGKMIHGVRTWYREFTGTANSKNLERKIGERVDAAGRRFEEGGKLADYAGEGVEKASEMYHHVVDDAQHAFHKGEEDAKTVGEHGSQEANLAMQRAKEKDFEAAHKNQPTGGHWVSWLSNTVSSAWDAAKTRLESIWMWNRIANRRRKSNMDKAKIQKKVEHRKEDVRQAARVVKDTAKNGKEKVEELLNESIEFGKEKVAISADWVEENAEHQKAKLDEAIHNVNKMAKDTVDAGKRKAEDIAHQATDKAKEGVEKAQQAAGWIKEHVDQGAAKAENVLHEVADKAKETVEEGKTKAKEELHAAKAGISAVKEDAKENVRSAAGRVKETVIEGIHRVEKVGEGIKEAVEHKGEKIFHDGKCMIKEGTECVTRPFVRDTQLHRNKLHGEYFNGSPDTVRVPRGVLTIGDVAPLTTIFSGILGIMYLMLAYRVFCRRRQTGVVVSDRHSVAQRHRETSIANVIKGKPRKGQETLSEISLVEDTAVTSDGALLDESVESLTTFTHNTVISLILLALNEIAGYRSPILFLYIFYITGSLLTAFGGYDTEIGNGRREVGQYMTWTVIAVSSALNLWAGIWDAGMLV